MPADLSPIDRAKYAASRRAVDFVEDGMRVGLGTGSTAAWMVRCLAERVKAEGLTLQCVPTSTRTAELGRELGLNIVTLEEAGWLDRSDKRLRRGRAKAPPARSPHWRQREASA